MQVERTEEVLAEVTSEKQRLKELAKERRATAANVIMRMLADNDEARSHSALLSWRLAASRKVRTAALQ